MPTFSDALPEEPLRVLTLGGLRAVQADGVTDVPVQRKRLGLVVILLMAGENGISRDKAASLLWPESDEVRARQSLKQATFALREALGTAAIDSSGGTLRLNRRLVSSDFIDLQEALRRNDAPAAMALYRGPFLDGWHLADGEEFERMVEDTRGQLHHRVGGLLRRCALAESFDGSAEVHVAMLEALLELEPLEPGTIVRLMQLDVEGGRVAAAIRRGEAFQERARSELGAEIQRVAGLLSELRTRLASEESASGDVPADLTKEPGKEVYTQARKREGIAMSPSLPVQRPSQWRRVSALAAVACVALLAGWTIRARSSSDAGESKARAAADSIGRGLDAYGRRVAHAAQTSRSARAQLDFVRGLRSFHAGAYDSAVAQFSSAAQEDSTLALAWLWQSMAADWVGRPLIIHSGAVNALRFRSHLAEEDRLVAEGWYEMKFGRLAAAESLFTNASNSYPADEQAWLQLGEVLFHGNSVRGRSAQDALGPFRHVVALDTGDLQSVHHLIRLAAMRHDVREVDSLTSACLHRHDPDSLELDAFRAAVLGDPERIRTTEDALFRQDPSTLSAPVWRTAVYGRNLEEAARMATRLLADPRAAQVHAFAAMKLAEIRVGEGRWRVADSILRNATPDRSESMLEMRAALAVVPTIAPPAAEIAEIRGALRSALRGEYVRTQSREPVVLYLIGLLSDRLHDKAALDEAERGMRTWPRSDTASALLRMSYARGLAGLSLRLRGDTLAAIDSLLAIPFDQLQEARSGSGASQTYERWVLSQLLVRKGRVAEGAAWRHAIGDGLETSWYPVAAARQD